ncbi:MAG: hypothetical protein AABY22_09945 [Nanoarchaeota archaeon]
MKFMELQEESILNVTIDKKLHQKIKAKAAILSVTLRNFVERVFDNATKDINLEVEE